jgi:YHS domain-containing protein
MDNISISDPPPQSSPGKTACGGLVDNPEAFASAVYRGERVYFCMLACLRAFEENPDPFMAGEVEHPVDPI